MLFYFFKPFAAKVWLHRKSKIRMMLLNSWCRWAKPYQCSATVTKVICSRTFTNWVQPKHVIWDKIFRQISHAGTRFCKRQIAHVLERNDLLEQKNKILSVRIIELTYQMKLNTMVEHKQQARIYSFW